MISNSASLNGGAILFFTTLITGTVADDLAALLQCLDTAYIHTDGRVELQCTATGRSLRIAEHDTDLFTQLVDKDHGTVGLADDTGQLAQVPETSVLPADPHENLPYRPRSLLLAPVLPQSPR